MDFEAEARGYKAYRMAALMAATPATPDEVRALPAANWPIAARLAGVRADPAPSPETWATVAGIVRAIREDETDEEERAG